MFSRVPLPWWDPDSSFCLPGPVWLNISLRFQVFYQLPSTWYVHSICCTQISREEMLCRILGLILCDSFYSRTGVLRVLAVLLVLNSDFYLSSSERIPQILGPCFLFSLFVLLCELADSVKEENSTKYRGSLPSFFCERDFLVF